MAIENPGVLRKILAAIYSPDSYDIAYDSHFAAKTEATKDYRYASLTIFTSFLGLPNHCPPGKKLTWKRIGRNLLGLQDNKSKERRKWNRRLAPFKLLLNLGIAVFKTVQNTFKLVTEVAPAVATALFAVIMIVFGGISGGSLGLIPVAVQLSRGFFSTVFFTIPLILIGLASFAAFGAVTAASFFALSATALAAYIGRAITSPVDNVRASWFAFVSPAKPRTPLRMAAGFLFAALSITITFMAYAVLLSPLLPFIGINAALLSAHLAPGFATFLSNLGSLPYVIKAGLNVTLAGFSAFVGTTIAITGPFINDIYNLLKEKWETSGNPPKPPREPIPCKPKPVRAPEIINQQDLAPVVEPAPVVELNPTQPGLHLDPQPSEPFNAKEASVVDLGLFQLSEPKQSGSRSESLEEKPEPASDTQPTLFKARSRSASSSSSSSSYSNSALTPSSSESESSEYSSISSSYSSSS